jgi:hypothetical protein
MVWRKPSKWTWTTDAEPCTGSTEYSVEIKPDCVEWSYREDRWSRSDRQSHSDFATFGPLWSTPAEILNELARHFGLRGKPWQEPGYVDYSPVWRAVYASEPNAHELLTGADANRRYHGQRTLLMLAAEKNAVLVVSRLLDMGANPNARDEYGLTPLIEVCGQPKPSIQILQQLLDHGADVNARDPFGRTPFILCCTMASPTYNSLRMLIERGAVVRASDHNGRSAQDYLAGKDLPRSIRELLWMEAADAMGS